MQTMVTVTDVADRLGDDIPEEDHRRVLGLLDEAVELVTSYLGRPIPTPIPNAVKLVVSRMVARVMQAPTDSFSVDTISQNAGAFGMSRKFTTGASGGAPWLTAQDKTMLKPFKRRRGFYSIPML